MVPTPGMALATEPAAILPHMSDTPLRGSTRRESTSWAVVATAPRAPMRSPLSCGREVCPPGPRTVTSTRSTAEVMAPGLQGQLTGVGPRVAVHRVHLGQAVDRPAGDGVDRSAGAQLLGRLEDQPDAALELPPLPQPGQHQTGPRARPWCARRARRRGRSRPTATGTERSCRPGSAVRRCPPAGPPGRSPGRSRPGSRSQTAPVPMSSTLAVRPASPSVSTMSWVVRNSWLPISGWACRSRRNSTRRPNNRSVSAAIRAGRSVSADPTGTASVSHGSPERPSSGTISSG